jgi:hypothetical protein
MSRAGIEPALSRCMVRIETILIVSFFFAVQSAIKAFLLPFILFIVLAILPLTTDILLFPLLANRMNQHVVQHKVIHLLLLSIEVVQPSMFG